MKKGSIPKEDFKALKHILVEVMGEPAFEEARLYLVEGMSLSEIGTKTGRNKQTIHNASTKMWRIYQGFLAAKKEIIRSEKKGAKTKEA